MKTKVIGLLMLATTSLLGGCNDVPDTAATSANATTSGTTAPGTTAPSATYTMTLVPTLATLSAGGTTAVTATILANGVVDATQAVEVSFTSTCVAQSKALLDNPVVSSAGVAVSSYRDVKCASTDTLAASAIVGGKTITASAQIVVQPANMGSIVFVSATPPNIGIKGVGLTETSVVRFQVMDVLGQSAPAGQSVTFSLDNTMGGITYSPTSALTDSFGAVTTTITSGTVATTVRVKAALTSDPTIQTQSDGLVISTGVSDQNSFSLSADVMNVEGWAYDGEKVTLTIRASDHFNNPVPNGAAVLFTTNGGQVVSNCVISNGACSVMWTSQNPRPTNGRVVVLATMTGEESFTDLNGNNRFDDGETFFDLPEAWLDANENGSYDAGAEEFRDFNTNGTYTAADGKYNGILCAGPTLCGTSKSLDVRASMTLIMSESFFNFIGAPASISVPVTTSQTVTVDVCGSVNGQIPPAGTKLAVSTTYGTATLVGGDTVLNYNGTACHSQTFTFTAGTAAGSGTLELRATTPKGNLSWLAIPVSGF